MICKLCNEKKGSTRCEGCDMLFCLQCMNKHHGELIQQFQQLMDMRNELKESFDTGRTAAEKENQLPCFMEVDQWERKTIERVRKVARQVRTNINEMMAKNMTEIRHQLEQLSAHMQRQEKEGNYLENDIENVKLRLDQLKETIQHVNDKIQVIISDNVNWDKVIYVITDQNIAVEDCQNSSEYFMQDKVSSKQEKQLNTESRSRRRREKQSIFRHTTFIPLSPDDSRAFRPITPEVLSDEDSSDSEKNSSLFGRVIPVDRTVPMLPTTEPSFSWKTIFSNKPNT